MSSVEGRRRTEDDKGETKKEEKKKETEHADKSSEGKRNRRGKIPRKITVNEDEKV